MKRPLVPIVVGYCLGVVTADMFPVPLLPAFVFLLLCLVLLFGTLYCLRQTGDMSRLEREDARAVAGPHWRKRAFAAVLAIVVFWVLGIVFFSARVPQKTAPCHIRTFVRAGRVNVEGVIDSTPVHIGERTRLFLRATDVHTPKGSWEVSGRLMLTIKQPQKTFRYGDRIRFFCFLKKPKNFSNPGCFDYERYLAFRSVSVTAFLPDDTTVITLQGGEGSVFFLMVERYRDRIREAVAAHSNPPAADILTSLILGERASLPGDIKEQFVKLGIAHLLAISGLHIGLVAFVSYGLCMLLFKIDYRVLLYIDAYKWAVLFSAGPVVFYCFVAGLHLPTVRASIMVLCYVAAFLLGRGRDLMNTLCIAALLILLVMPAALFDVSFQLSFTAVAVLIALLPVMFLKRKKDLDDALNKKSRVLDRLFHWLSGPFLASAAAILGTAPLVILYFHRFSFLGFFFNVIAVPLVGLIIVPMGLLSTVLLIVSDSLAGGMFYLAGRVVEQLLVITSYWSRAVCIEITPSVPAFWEIALYYVLLLSLPVAVTKAKIRLFIAGFCLFLLVESGTALYQYRESEVLRVCFLDVGNGDAAVVQFPGRQVMLIDGGGLMDDTFDMGREVIAPVLYHLGIKRVQYVVLSHPHKDHFGGLPYIVEHFHTRELWYNGEHVEHPTFKRLVTAARTRGTHLKDCSAASSPVWIDGVKIAVFGPRAAGHLFSDGTYNDTNNNSLVLSISFNNISFLFTGDILRQREERLLESGADLESTIIKVPHHGRAGSSSAAFVECVQPDVAVVSCRGRVRQNVPDRRVLETYATTGALIYRTDIHGAITVTTDGVNYRIQPFLKTKNY